MSSLDIGMAIIGLLAVLLITGVPIALSLFAAGAVGLFWIRGVTGAEFIIEGFAYTASAHLSLVVIPLFIFMGHLAFSAGLSEKAYDAAKAWFGHVSGGLPIATVFACAGFATVCGSSVATAATVAKVTVPEMLKMGYSQRLAGGCVAAAGTLGVLIPPSGILIIYAIATNVSIADLFIAAFIPGILTAIAYAVSIHFMVRFSADREKTRLPRVGWPERMRTTARSWEIALLFSVVIGSMYLGIATATEAAGVGALLALGFAVKRRGRSFTEIRRGLVDTGSATAAIFLLIIGSGLFSIAIATTRLPTELAMWVGSLELTPTTLLLVLIIPYLVLGCFVDGVSMIFLTMPIVFPIIMEAGINPVLFGIIVTKMVEIGAITPPVGLNVYVVQGAVPELSITEVFRGVMPFVIIELLLVILFITFPTIVTFPVS